MGKPGDVSEARRADRVPTADAVGRRPASAAGTGRGSGPVPKGRQRPPQRSRAHRSSAVPSGLGLGPDAIRRLKPAGVRLPGQSASCRPFGTGALTSERERRRHLPPHFLSASGSPSSPAEGAAWATACSQGTKHRHGSAVSVTLTSPMPDARSGDRGNCLRALPLALLALRRELCPRVPHRHPDWEAVSGTNPAFAYARRRGLSHAPFALSPQRSSGRTGCRSRVPPTIPQKLWGWSGLCR